MHRTIIWLGLWSVFCFYIGYRMKELNNYNYLKEKGFIETKQGTRFGREGILTKYGIKYFSGKDIQ